MENEVRSTIVYVFKILRSFRHIREAFETALTNLMVRTFVKIYKEWQNLLNNNAEGTIGELRLEVISNSISSQRTPSNNY
jgi:hypothetical protein